MRKVQTLFLENIDSRTITIMMKWNEPWENNLLVKRVRCFGWSRTYKPWIGNSPISVKRKRIIFYPAVLARTQYVSGDIVILSISGSRLFLCVTVSCSVIPMDTHWFVYSRTKNRFNRMNHVGHVLNDYFNRTNPQWSLIMITQKKHVVVQT